MLSIDLQNAVTNSADNFTVKLFQLLLKADGHNFELLKSIYPQEAKMIWLYKNHCYYRDTNKTEVAWDVIEEQARSVIFLS